MTAAMRWVMRVIGAILLGGIAATAAAQAIEVQVLTDGLDSPWALAHLPDGGMLVTERSGALWRLDSRGVRVSKIENIPPAFVQAQGGLFDVVLHPEFASNSQIYLSFAQGKLHQTTLRVIRGELRGNSLTQIKQVFDSAPRKTDVHYGGSLAFQRDGTLLITIGDSFDHREDAQRLSVLRGKVARINDDGTVPADNPFVSQRGAEPSIWSYGHRNPQGLGIDPLTGAVYVSEHGPQGGDEVNIIERGINYGWPIATHGLDYTGAKISPFATYPGMREPLLFWDPSIAPSGIAVYRGQEFPEWDGDLFVAVLRNAQLRRIGLEGGKVQSEQFLLADRASRIRDVVVGSDGIIYAVAESVQGKEKSGQLLRISRSRQSPGAD
jgi:glucose/arabinose dehydrogenase